MNNKCNKCGNHVNNCSCIKYRVIAKFDNETRIYENNEMYSLLHQAKSTLSRTMNSKNYDSCYEGLVYIRTAWERRMQERKSKMTREEANEKLLQSGHSQYSYPLLDALEALGLIKFEEAKSKSID